MVNNTAIEKGERAKACLEEAERALDSASGWGLFDIFGGGTITTLVKHSRIEKARNLIYESKQYLWEFRREIAAASDCNIEIGMLLTFADFFWDGLLADILVQSKISEAKRQVSSAIRELDRALSRLRLV